jgi:drug/metabolite transporter (DMT)-like permease
MTDSILIAVLAGLVGMFGWGLADFFAKKTIDVAGDLATLALAHIFGFSFLAGLVGVRLINDGGLAGFSISIGDIGLLAFFGFVQAFVYYFAYRAFGKGKLALLNPVFSSYSAVTVLLSVFVFSEVITHSQVASLAVTFIGILLINLDRESFMIRRLKLLKIEGLGDIVSAAVLAAVWTVLWGHFVINKDWLMYAAIMYSFMTLTILGVVRFQKINLNVLHKINWKWFLAIGLTEVMAYVGISLGYSLTSKVSIIAVLSAAFSLPTVVFAYIFLKERITRLQLSGVAFVIAGVVLISLL